MRITALFSSFSSGVPKGVPVSGPDQASAPPLSMPSFFKPLEQDLFFGAQTKKRTSPVQKAQTRKTVRKTARKTTSRTTNRRLGLFSFKDFSKLTAPELAALSSRYLARLGPAGFAKLGAVLEELPLDFYRRLPPEFYTDDLHVKAHKRFLPLETHKRFSPDEPIFMSETHFNAHISRESRSHGVVLGGLILKEKFKERFPSLEDLFMERDEAIEESYDEPCIPLVHKLIDLGKVPVDGNAFHKGPKGITWDDLETGERCFTPLNPGMKPQRADVIWEAVSTEPDGELKPVYRSVPVVHLQALQASKAKSKVKAKR